MSGRLRALAITILVLGCAPAPQDPPIPERPKLFGPQTEPRKPTHHIRVIACGPAPPSTVSEWRHAAAGIVRVRINSHRTFERNPEPDWPPYIYTDLDVTVLDVYKHHPHAAGVGGTMTITHPGGRLERDEAYYVSETNKFPPPAVGTEWVLFLNWNEDINEFSIFFLQYGAFVIVENRIVPVADGRFAAVWSGREAENLAAVIRSHSGNRAIR